MKIGRRNVLGMVGACVAAMCLNTGALAQADKPAQPDKPKAAAAKIGEAAPAFSLTDTDGKAVKLADYKGKIVVLEWFNPGCPVVQMHYGAETMNKTIAQFKDKPVAWLRINSGAAGKQGAGKDANVSAKKEWNITTPILLDESGTVGKSYGAKTTPHCFVINQDGVLVYAGAIDDGNGGKVGTTNYVAAAVISTLNGETVAKAETKPYGCNVKY